jgi:ATP synthase protein I
VGTPGTHDDDDDKSGVSGYSKAMRSAAPLLNAGIQFAAAVVLMLFLGRWLDSRFGCAPWLMITGIFLGLGAGMVQFIRTVGAVDRQEAEDRKNHED